MHPKALARRSLTASCLLHLAAIACMAAWVASAEAIRPRYAGQSEAIELVVTRAKRTWSPDPVTFEDVVDNEVRVTVEPTTARIARKVFGSVNATELSLDKIVNQSLPVTSRIEINLAEQTRLESLVTVSEAPPQQAIVLSRQRPEPRDFQPAVVQPPRSLGTDRIAPSFTDSPPPNYPALAIQNNWEGTVLLRVYIGADGTVDELEVARSSGHAVLDGAAVNAVRRWRGLPAMQNGRAIATTELLPVRFKLRD